VAARRLALDGAVRPEVAQPPGGSADRFEVGGAVLDEIPDGGRVEDDARPPLGGRAVQCFSSTVTKRIVVEPTFSRSWISVLSGEWTRYFVSPGWESRTTNVPSVKRC